MENYYTEEELLKEFDFLLKDILGIEVYDSRDKKLIAVRVKNIWMKNSEPMLRINCWQPALDLYRPIWSAFLKLVMD
ncbi:MAG: hypothetical protein V8Q83_03135 [Blautia sp.]